MTRRPNPFNQSALEEALRKSGCPESFISSTVSNYRLFVPLLFAELGEERVFELICSKRDELGLGEQSTAWRSAIKYIVTWAEGAITDYKTRREHIAPPPLPAQEQVEQPRLL